MELRGRTIPFLLLLAIIGLIVAGILHVVGMATPNWVQTYTSYQTEEKLLRYSGLWIGCDQQGDDVFHCEPFSAAKEYLRAVQALCIVGFICGVGAIIFIGLYLFLANGKIKGIFKIAGLIFCLLAGLFVMIGVIVYGVKIDEQSGDAYLQMTNSLSWSFGLSVTSSAICILCAVCATVGAVRK